MLLRNVIRKSYGRFRTTRDGSPTGDGAIHVHNYIPTGDEETMPDWFKPFAAECDEKFKALNDALDAIGSIDNRHESTNSVDRARARVVGGVEQSGFSTGDAHRPFQGKGGLFAQGEMHRAQVAGLNAKNRERFGRIR